MLVNQMEVAKAKLDKVLSETMESKGKLLPLNLQFFAGEDGGDDGSGDDSGEGNDDGSEDKEGSTEGGSDTSKTESKTFSQDDVNKIATKEARKATEKLLKQLGVQDFKSAKDGLAKFKELTDSQKSDVEKAIEKAKALEGEKGQLSSQVSTLSAQVAAMKADVNPDSLDDVIVLANNLTSDDVTVDDAIKQVLKKYPHFKRTADTEGTTKKPKFSEGEHKKDDKVTDVEQWASAFKFQ